MADAAVNNLTVDRMFGDMVRPFRLTPPMILELERKTGVGIGGLCQRMFRREFGFAEISETIRLALIGGGQDPVRAAELVATYVNDRPLAETYPLAVAILETLWFGKASTNKESETE